jgi:hypothetical protein
MTCISSSSCANPSLHFLPPLFRKSTRKRKRTKKRRWQKY